MRLPAPNANAPFGILMVCNVKVTKAMKGALKKIY
jgi:hypothetical protein